MTTPIPAQVPWPALLDALEERLRRLESAAVGDGDAPTAWTEMVPDGPLPEALRLRALSLFEATRRLEDDVARRVGGAQRALTYTQR